MDVKKYLPQKTPIGFAMKESAEGYYVMVEDFDRVTDERNALQKLLNARDEEIGVMRRELDALLNHCEDGECVTCAAIICPVGDGMHFHHDGCPGCAEAEAEQMESQA